MKSRYINPFTDFGFKKLFGEDASKPMLIDFLTSLLPESNIIDLSFKDKEKQGKTDDERKAIYDIYCDTNRGEKIIVELQKAKQNYFKDRTIFYSTFPIQEQAERGDWDYELKAVYCVGILDFKFDDYKNSSEENEVVHSVQLKDQNNKVFYEELKFVYLEMPHFNTNENELKTRLDKWLYFIKHLEDFQDIPTVFKDEIFTQAFKKAEIANYTEQERNNYEQSLKTYRDLKNVIDTAIDNNTLQIAKQLKTNGVSIEIISTSTGLTKEDIDKL